jgi:hypothetical protein
VTAIFDQPRETRRILSIDGGGMRGALAVGILAELERTLREKLGKPDLLLCDYFDLIGGTSTGAIIAAGLALGKDAEYLRELYHRLGPMVFRKHMPRIWGVQSRFDPKGLERVIKQELGDVTLGSARWRTGFAAVAKRVDTGSSWVLSNCPGQMYWEGDPEEIAAQPDPNLRKVVPNRDYPLAKIVQASAAAPFFFDMVRLEITKGEPGVFFDGAMTPHGNPALQLAMTALIPGYGLKWKAGADKLMIVSIGTGQHRPAKPSWVLRPSFVAIWKALHALTSLSYDTSQLAISMLQWLGESPRRWRINADQGDLSNSLPMEKALWTFVRYDCPLESRWLEPHLGISFPEAELNKLQRMDDDRKAPELYRIGRIAGAALISRDHFPDVFDPQPAKPPDRQGDAGRPRRAAARPRAAAPGPKARPRPA